MTPQKGDVLWKGTVSNRVVRLVVFVERQPSMVQVVEGRAEGDYTRERRPTLRQYRRWAEEAYVMRRADGG